MSISSILNIAKNAIAASQTSMQVVSHNIANVNTKGYSRQEAILEEETPSLLGAGFLGNGAKVANIIRYYDRYLENQISNKNTDLEEQKVYKQYFERIEGIFNEDSSKLSKNITDFFNGWQDLSLDPQSVALREGIVAKGKNMIRSIQNIYTELKGLQTEQDNNVNKEVDDINRIITSIASLNTKVFEGSSTRSEANDYIDARTELIKELSGKIDITTFEDEYNRTTILTSKGKMLVDGGNSWNLNTVVDDDTGYWDVAWEDSSGNLSDITGDLTAGRLKALIEMRDENVVEFIQHIDELAEVLITEVNDIHDNGYTLNHVPVGPPDAPDGILFFKNIAGNYAKDIDLSNEIKADAKNIAASAEADALTGNPVGNGIATDIAAFIDSNAYYDGSSNIIVYASSIVNKVGQYTRGAIDSSEYSQDAMTIIEKQRESVSGVSLDEEMANLIKFQYAFQAASRLFNVVDELFASILEASR